MNYVAGIPINSVKVGDRFREKMGNLDELAESIKYKGLIQPITIDQHDNLLAGGRRYLACKQLGMETIDVIVRQVSGAVDALEVELFENIHRKDLNWHEEVRLVQAIHATIKEGRGSKVKVAKLLDKKQSRISQQLDIAMALDLIPDLVNCGSEDEARKKFKKIAEKVLIDSTMDEIKKSKKEDKKETPRTRVLKWADDHYKIGDAIEGMKKLNAGIMHFAEVDPPYAIDLHEKKSKGSANIEHYNEIKGKDYEEFLFKAATLVFRVLDHNAICVWWFAPSWHETVRDTLKDVGFKVDDIPAIWYKVDSSATSNTPNIYLARSYEPFFICRKGTPAIRNRGRSNVFAFKTVKLGDKIHPTERPVELITELYNTFVYPGSRVLVPFLGSGASLIAAYSCNLTAFGWDLTDAFKPQFLAKVNNMVLEEESSKA